MTTGESGVPNAESIVKSVAWLGPLIGVVIMGALGWSSLQNNVRNMQERLTAAELSLTGDIKELRAEAARELARTDTVLRDELKRVVQDAMAASAQSTNATANMISALSTRLTELNSQIGDDRRRINEFIDARYNPHMDDVRERVRLAELKMTAVENELARLYHALELMQQALREGRVPDLPLPGPQRQDRRGALQAEPNLFAVRPPIPRGPIAVRGALP